ncbi:hypothetical protein [Sphingomonas sp.]|uniref:hypothetical protein n=1 Tax=Sphingomonas sp. TaxID=28214 RepID=UPI003CC5D6BC
MVKLDHDSDGNVYEVWKQQQESSCGVASIWMARCLVQQKSINEDEWSLARAVYISVVGQTLAAMDKRKDDGPQSYDATKLPANRETSANAIASGGYSAEQIRTALIGQGLSVDASIPDGAGTPFNASKLGDRRPAVVLVQWKNGAGHFVVAARQSSYGTIVFLDPWDGKVNERPNTTRYRGRYGNAGQIVAVLYLS